MSITLSLQQEQAVKAFSAWFKDARFGLHEVAPFFYLAGYAGSGKTSILKFLVESSRIPESRIAILAPTGKAVAVATKKLQAMGIDIFPQTIHSAIYRPKIVPVEQIEAKVLSLKAKFKANPDDAQLKETLRLAELDLDRAYKSEAPKFSLNIDAAAIRNAELVIVDECSMVGDEIAADLRGFGKPILAIGDPGQLPPVGGLPGFCFRDPDFFLSEIHRQARDNPILWLAEKLRNGERAPLGTHGDRLKVVRAKDDVDTFDITRDIQVIVGTNETRRRINRQVRELCGFGPVGPRAGEMMICLKNSLKNPGLVNGSMLMVEADAGDLQEGKAAYKVKVRTESGDILDLKCVQAYLEETYLGKDGATAPKRDIYEARNRYEHLDWASAITAHKSQGSQWNDVVVHDEGGFFRDDVAKWRYTAATRAAERLTWVV